MRDFAALTIAALLLMLGNGCGSGAAPTPAVTFTLSGTVVDKATVGAIAGASVSVPGQMTTTDSVGSYVLRLTAGTYSVTFAAAGYSAAVATITVSADTTYRSALAINAPDSPTTSNLTGTWSGAGTYPNAPFQLFLAQNGSRSWDITRTSTILAASAEHLSRSAFSRLSWILAMVLFASSATR